MIRKTVIKIVIGNVSLFSNLSVKTMLLIHKHLYMERKWIISNFTEKLSNKFTILPFKLQVSSYVFLPIIETVSKGKLEMFVQP